MHKQFSLTWEHSQKGIVTNYVMYPPDDHNIKQCKAPYITSNMKQGDFVVSMSSAKEAMACAVWEVRIFTIGFGSCCDRI